MYTSSTHESLDYAIMSNSRTMALLESRVVGDLNLRNLSQSETNRMYRLMQLILFVGMEYENSTWRQMDVR